MKNEELDRLNQLKAMHQLMLITKNDSIYNRWIEVFIDMPSQFDFEMVAKDNHKFIKCYNIFCELVTDNGYLNRILER